MALVGGCRGVLAGELGPAGGGEGGGLVGFDVWGALAAVEDVVGGDVDDARFDRGGRGGDVAGAGAVPLHRRRLGLLGPAAVRPGGAVDDDVGALELELAIDR